MFAFTWAIEWMYMFYAVVSSTYTAYTFVRFLFYATTGN